MSTFPILPYTSEAKLAIGEVKKHIDKFKYPHFIKVVGKLNRSGSMSKFSHICIITDPIKAEEEDCWSPQEWLDTYMRPASNRFKVESSKL